MKPQDAVYQSVVSLWIGLIAGVLLVAASAAGQALSVTTLDGGTQLVHVAMPLADATSTAWPVPTGDGFRVAAATSGTLTFAADLEAALGAEPEAPAPPVVVVVGGAAADEVQNLVVRLLAGRRSALLEPAPQAELVEGGVERRLAPAGADAVLRLEVALPPPADWQRSAVEVLWQLLPDLLGPALPGLQSRVEGDVGVLEARVDSELAELRLRGLRRDLARVVAEPRLEAAAVSTATVRLQVRRQALLETHPDAARSLASTWLRGGTQAVRQHLFGLDGVTLASVRRAAAAWLPEHPGAAVLLLPPRVFSPRFASRPQQIQLDNDLAAAVLERPGTALAVLSLRPVIVPDVDGELTAVVLARLAAELRAAGGAPPWIRVGSAPPRLDLAAGPGAFPELCEVLQLGLERLEGDRTSALPPVVDARRRALQLMAVRLGLGRAEDLTPAWLLRPGNLAMGAVVVDAEAAVEAMHKLLVAGGRAEQGLTSQALDPGQRSREAAPGDRSVLAVAVPLPTGAGRAQAAVVAELLRVRGASELDDADVEVLSPHVPGRPTLVLVVAATGQLDQLEDRVRSAWPRLTGQTTEAELGTARREMAAELAAMASGSLGHAQGCAQLAAGVWPWQSPTELEMAALTLDVEQVDAVLAGANRWDGLDTTGAGVLPISTAIEGG